MYALCDVDSMYASCEKVFDPTIRKRPVVVLTNNDGCICAACSIAKSMGLGKKFVPYFKVKDDLARAGVVIRSSNYELYADMSQRFMDICTEFAPHSHIYSIDECFLYYGAGYIPSEGWEEHARSIRSAVWKNVRLPIGVGVGCTPTLAKAANHAAKRLEGYRGVAVIDSEEKRKDILRQMEVTDIWGIGRRLGRRFNNMGIHNALQLSQVPVGLIRKQFSILVESTVHELNGTVRLSWDEVRAPKKEIFSTRSFGQRVTDKIQLRQAIITHVGVAAQKLRKEHSHAGMLLIFASNSPHDNAPFYRKSATYSFPAYTSDTKVISVVASRLVDQVYQEGIYFYKCGVGLLNLVGNEQYQQDLFQSSQDKPALMSCIDEINKRYGRGTIHIAGQGVDQKFSMRRAYLSPQYTTRLSDLPIIRCD